MKKNPGHPGALPSGWVRVDQQQVLDSLPGLAHDGGMAALKIHYDG
jgi:hypothetical protein